MFSLVNILRKLFNLMKNFMNLLDNILSIKNDLLIGRRSKGSVKNSSIFGEVVFFALHHIGDFIWDGMSKILENVKGLVINLNPGHINKTILLHNTELPIPLLIDQQIPQLNLCQMPLIILTKFVKMIFHKRIKDFKIYN